MVGKKPPTTANSKTANGTGTGSFTSSLTGLTAMTLYYVRAYATNGTGTTYGNEVTFTALQNIVPPTVATAAISAITQTTATSGGNVTSEVEQLSPPVGYVGQLIRMFRPPIIPTRPMEQAVGHLPAV